MAITRISQSAYVTATGGGSVTPTLGTYAVDDLMLLVCAEAIGTATMATPSGWTELNPDVNAHQIKIFGKFATSLSETIPALTFGGASTIGAAVYVYRGVDLSFATTASAGDRSVASAVSGITCIVSARTPTGPGLVFGFGTRNKTSSTDGQTLSAATNFTMLTQVAPNGSNTFCMGAEEWIQSVATTVPAFTGFSSSPAESTGQNNQGSMIFLQPAAIAPIPTRSLLGVGN